MKIIRNNVCYIEVDDLKFLEKLPANIMIELKMGYSNGYKFQKFFQKEAINFFAKNPYIIDYNLVYNLSIEELEYKIEIVRQILEKYCLNWLESYESTSNGYFTINGLKHILKTLENYKNNKLYYDSQIMELFNSKQKRL